MQTTNDKKKSTYKPPLSQDIITKIKHLSRQKLHPAAIAKICNCSLGSVYKHNSLNAENQIDYVSNLSDAEFNLAKENRIKTSFDSAEKGMEIYIIFRSDKRKNFDKKFTQIEDRVKGKIIYKDKIKLILEINSYTRETFTRNDFVCGNVWMQEVRR